MKVSIVSPDGEEIVLAERSKTHYLDQTTFFMNYAQLEAALTSRGMPCVASSVEVEGPSTIRFLDMKTKRKDYMKKIVDLKGTVEIMNWPSQNNRTSIAGSSRGLFLGAQTNRGFQQGCVAKRTFAQYLPVLKRVHSLARCCTKELPYMGMYLTKLEAGQGLSQHKDYRNHPKYLNYTINFGHYEGGHLEMLRNDEWESCAVPLMWVELTADIIRHRVREVTKGTRYSLTLFTPSRLERLSQEDWMNLESFGFPVDMYPEKNIAMSSAPEQQAAMELETSALEKSTEGSSNS